MASVQTDSEVGAVTAFDEPRGIGEVTSNDGRVLGFHCAAIADGTRTIEVGAAVRFNVIGAHHGRWEAWAITPA